MSSDGEAWFSDHDWQAAIDAAQRADLDLKPPMTGWSRVPGPQVARLLTGAIEHLARGGLIEIPGRTL